MNRSSRMTLNWISLFGLLVAVTTAAMKPAIAILSDYTPISKVDLKKQFTLKPVKDADKLRQGETVRTDNISFSLDDKAYELKIDGRTKSGKPWRITKHYFGLGTMIFTADLDLNGVRDLVLLQATGGCGIAPPAVLTVILRDKNLFPDIAEFSSYSTMDSDDWEGKRPVAHIDDVLDLNGDNKADIVIEQLDYADVNGKTRSYWRTLIYTAKNGHLTKMPAYKGYALPTLVAYKYRANHKVVTKPAQNLKVFDDGGLIGPKKSAIVSAVHKDDHEGVDQLTLSGVGTLAASADPASAVSQSNLFEPFLTVNYSDRTEICGLDTSAFSAALSQAAEQKKTMTYVARSLKGRMPLRMQLDL